MVADAAFEAELDRSIPLAARPDALSVSKSQAELFGTITIIVIKLNMPLFISFSTSRNEMKNLIGASSMVKAVKVSHRQMQVHSRMSIRC